MPENQNQNSTKATDAPAAWANRSLKKAAAIKMEAARDLQAAGEAQELVSRAAGELGGSIDATSEKLDQIRLEVKGFREETARLSGDLLAALDRAEDELRAIHGGVAGGLAEKVRDAVCHADGEEGEKTAGEPMTTEQTHSPNESEKAPSEAGAGEGSPIVAAGDGQPPAPTELDRAENSSPDDGDAAANDVAAHDGLIPFVRSGEEIPHERIKELLAKAKEHGLEGKVSSILVKIFAGENKDTVIARAEGFIEGRLDRDKRDDAGTVEDIDDVLDEESVGEIDETGNGDADEQGADALEAGDRTEEGATEDDDANESADTQPTDEGDGRDDLAAAAPAAGDDSAEAGKAVNDDTEQAVGAMQTSGGWCDQCAANMASIPDSPAWSENDAEGADQDQ